MINVLYHKLLAFYITLIYSSFPENLVCLVALKSILKIGIMSIGSDRMQISELYF
jgi:hypothetical protein